MRRIPLPLCILAAALIAADAQAQPADTRAVAVRQGGKVTAPVEIEIVPLADPGPGRRRVRIVARPTVDAASLAIDVAAEDGLALANPADAAWTGAAQLGHEVVREVDLAVSGPGELRLIVAATVKHEGGASQTGLHAFAFNPADDDALKRAFRVPTDPGGRVIVEVRAGRP